MMNIIKSLKAVSLQSARCQAHAVVALRWIHEQENKDKVSSVIRSDEPTSQELLDKLQRYEDYEKVNSNHYNPFSYDSSPKTAYMSPKQRLSRFSETTSHYLDKTMIARLSDQQEYVSSRIDKLGPDLAVAHFLVSRGASVRFRGDDEWIDDYGLDMCTLPVNYDSSFVLEEINLRKFDLLPEGMITIDNLRGLKSFIADGCETMSDAILDKISAQFIDTLEFLDISRCFDVTQSGIIALAKINSLKRLKMEELDHIPDIQLICLMLTEVRPDLIIEGISFEDDAEYIDELDYDKELKFLDEGLDLTFTPKIEKQEGGSNKDASKTTTDAKGKTPKQKEETAPTESRPERKQVFS